LEKIVDGNPVCVAKDNTYTCAPNQVLAGISPSGGAICSPLDAEYICAVGEVLQRTEGGIAVCATAICPDGLVLQKIRPGTLPGESGMVCVARDGPGATCPLGQVVIGVVNGVPTCSAAPSPSVGAFGGMYSTHLRDGCYHAKPLTGRCSCPWYAPVAHFVHKSSSFNPNHATIIDDANGVGSPFYFGTTYNAFVWAMGDLNTYVCTN
jgi:hypothetical protein